MSIRHLLLGNTALVVIMTVILVALSIRNDVESRHRFDAIELADQIEQGAQELALLSEEYLQHRLQRIESQWQTRMARIRELLKAAPNPAPPLLADIATDLTRLDAAFTELKALSIPTNDPHVPQAATVNDDEFYRSRLATRMRLIYTRISLTTSRHAEEALKDSRRILERSDLTLVVYTIVLLATVSLATIVLTRTITSKISILDQSARAISRGRLEEPVTNLGNDEFGELARSMEQMRLEILQRSADIAASASQYRNIFEDSPISLWHEDFSAVKQRIDNMRGQGITDFEHYFEAHPESVAEMLAAIRVLDVNRASVQLYRAASKVELMDSLDRTFTEESLAVFKRELVAIARGDAFFNAEAVTCDLAGNRIAIQIFITLPDPASRFESVHVAIVDITGEKQVEASLNESEQRFRAFAESAADWFWETGPDNRFTYASGRVYEVMGIGPESVVGHTRDELHRIEENGSAADWKTLRSLTNKRSEVADFPIKWKKPNGDLRHLEINGRPFFDAAGTFKGYRGTGRDVTEAKQTELELEQRVAERTVKLQEANEKLQQLDRLKSMFIASMSHELRTPLNSIIGFSGVLLREIPGPINAKQRDHLQRVKRSGQHLLALISDVIDVSKLEAGKIEPHFESFSLRELIAEAVGAMQPEIDRKGLKIIADDPPVGGIVSDRKRLLQCLLNLLSNAVKFTDQGSISLTVKRAEDQLRFEVSDTGIGIAADDLPRLFQAFSRLNTGQEALTMPGTGLGLYLTRKLAREVLQGDVLVQSEPGLGSTFALVIPTRPLPMPQVRSSGRG